MTNALRAISKELDRRGLHSKQAATVIANAKVPIVKTTLRRLSDANSNSNSNGGRAGGGGIPADISLGVRNGMQAVAWVASQEQVCLHSSTCAHCCKQPHRSRGSWRSQEATTCKSAHSQN